MKIMLNLGMKTPKTWGFCNLLFAFSSRTYQNPQDFDLSHATAEKASEPAKRDATVSVW